MVDVIETREGRGACVVAPSGERVPVHVSQ